MFGARVYVVGSGRYGFNAGYDTWEPNVNQYLDY